MSVSRLAVAMSRQPRTWCSVGVPEATIGLRAGPLGRAVDGDDRRAAEADVVLERHLGAVDLALVGLPRSCQVSSLHWARPVAPSGWPFEISPPEGLTTGPSPP